MMGKILIEADTSKRTVKATGYEITNVDFVSVIADVVKKAASEGMISDYDVALLAKTFMDEALPICKLKVPKTQRHTSREFENLDDAVSKFDKYLREVFRHE